jgi:transcriptional regulator with XRE-family HTH domain
LKTFGERLRYIQKTSGRNQVEFAQSLGISKGSLILYQKNKRHPDSLFLKALCETYKVNPAWLLLAEGDPVIEEKDKSGVREGKVGDVDPVVQLFNAEIEQTGLILTPEQRTAILKILREFVHRDVRLVRELIRSIHAGKQGNGL